MYFWYRFGIDITLRWDRLHPVCDKSPFGNIGVWFDRACLRDVRSNTCILMHLEALEVGLREQCKEMS